MIRILLSLFVICTALGVRAQDPEFPDNRNKRESFLKMAEKDLRRDLSSFTITGVEERVGKEPLITIPPTNTGSNFITFEGQGIKVTITAGTFEPAKHKLGYFDGKHLIKIDGRPFYGDFGTVPKTTIASVVVVVGKDTVAIPPAAYADLYSPLFTYRDASGNVRTYNAVYYASNKQAIYVYMQNKESSGKYEVTWIIQDKKYLRRVVDTGILK